MCRLSILQCKRLACLKLRTLVRFGYSHKQVVSLSSFFFKKRWPDVRLCHQCNRSSSTPGFSFLGREYRFVWQTLWRREGGGRVTGCSPFWGSVPSAHIWVRYPSKCTPAFLSSPHLQGLTISPCQVNWVAHVLSVESGCPPIRRSAQAWLWSPSKGKSRLLNLSQLLEIACLFASFNWTNKHWFVKNRFNYLLTKLH